MPTWQGDDVGAFVETNRTGSGDSKYLASVKVALFCHTFGWVAENVGLGMVLAVAGRTFHGGVGRHRHGEVVWKDGDDDRRRGGGAAGKMGNGNGAMFVFGKWLDNEGDENEEGNVADRQLSAIEVGLI